MMGVPLYLDNADNHECESKPMHRCVRPGNCFLELLTRRPWLPRYRVHFFEVGTPKVLCLSDEQSY